MAPPLVGDRIRGASVVPQNLSITGGERRDGAGQSARIGAEEQIDTILGQESPDILPRAFRSAPVVQGDQAERVARPRGTHGQPALPLDMVRPEPEGIRGLPRGVDTTTLYGRSLLDPVTPPPDRPPRPPSPVAE